MSRSGGTAVPVSESGSVSVLLTAITAAFVLLGALLIDYSRIAAFRKQAELAVQSGVRSVLSSYDPAVYADYGLFIRGGDDAGEILRTAAEGHFMPASEGGSFPYLDVRWVDTGVTESRPLADHDVFRRQIAEEMKYKAPVDLALELADRFRGIGPAVEQASAATDMLGKLDEAYERREAALDEALSAQQSGGGKVAGILRNVLSGGSSYSEAAATVLSETSAAERSAAAAVATAEAVNGEMRSMAESAAAEPPTSPAGEGETDLLTELRESAGQLVLSESFFGSYREELNEQAEAGRRMANLLAQLAVVGAGNSEVDEAVEAAAASRYSELRGRLVSVSTEYRAAYGPDGGIIRNRRDLLESHRGHESRKRELESEAGAGWASWKGWLNRLRGAGGSAAERDSFREADRLSRDNLDWNRAAVTETESAAGSSAYREGAEEAMTGTARLLDGLEASLSGARDRLFFSEYVMTRLSHFPPAGIREGLKGGTVAAPLEKQEAEYVLYGFANPTGNLAAAYAEIFAFRLAVRLTEGLIESRGLGHPLLVLAGALAYGIRHALADLNLLVTQGVVPLSKYSKIDTTYTDYLRLFLLFHGGKPEHLARGVAVLEIRTGLSFSSAYTYASAEGTASLRLWFFPGLLKLLGRTGQLGGRIEGSRYEADYRADSSYQ